MENSQIRTILLALASELDAGAELSPALKKATSDLTTLEPEQAPEPEQEPEAKKYPLQITVRDEDVAQIRSLYGIISGSKILVKQQERLLLALIDELKGYYNVPTEVGYDLNVASKESEATCFIREDIYENVAQNTQASPNPSEEPSDGSP